MERRLRASLLIPESSRKLDCCFLLVWFIVIINQKIKQIQRRLMFAHLLQYGLQKTEGVQQMKKTREKSVSLRSVTAVAQKRKKRAYI